WCASSNSRSGPTSCSTGRRCTRCATRTASAGWRAGSTRPSANRDATACACQASPYSDRDTVRRTATPACAPWPCCRPKEGPVRRAERVPLDRSSRRWALAAAAACLLPLLLQLPATMALGCVGVGLLVVLASRRRPLPAWIRVLLALCLVGMVLSMSRFSLGRDTACALLAAMLAIKPGELATLRDARSLVGFALFAPFSTFLLDQGPLSLALGMAGVVIALAALAQLSER